MTRISPPLKVGARGFGTHYNQTLHGRSVFRAEDKPGHNVFSGYKEWESNGRYGIGDALDCFCPGRTPVYAMHSGQQTRWYNDATRLEVIYIEGEGCKTVYAHINARFERKSGQVIKRGDLVGWVRSDLNDPHLHLEVWIDGKVVAAASPNALASKLIELSLEPATPTAIVNGTRLEGEVVEIRDGQLWAWVRPIVEAVPGSSVTWDDATKTAEFRFGGE